MCYDKIHIINRTNHFRPGIDRLYIDVPCGKCGSCRDAFNKEWYARIYYQWLEYIDVRKGWCYFETFTWNESTVPHKFGIRCFSNRHYRMFSHNLTMFLKRAGYSVKDGDVSWVMTCEYGGTTFRPHMHGLFFIDGKVDIDEKEFAALLAKAWTYTQGRVNSKEFRRIPLGFTSTTQIDVNRRKRPADNVVKDRLEALGYVNKYMAKDFDFEQVITKQIDSEYNGPAYEDLTKEDRRDFFPFHRQTNGFGLYIKDAVDWQDLVDGRIKVPDKNNKDGFILVSVPRYIDRKVFYIYDKKTKEYHLNEDGKKMKEHRYLHNCSYVKKQFLFALNNFSSLVTQEFKDKYRLTCTSRFRSCFESLLADRDLDDLAEYILTYKDQVDISCDDYVPDAKLMRLQKYEPSDNDFCMVDAMRGNYGKQLFTYRHVDYTGEQFYNRCCNSLMNRKQKFENFEEIIQMFNDLTKFYGQAQQRAYIERKREESRQKAAYIIKNSA